MILFDEMYFWKIRTMFDKKKDFWSQNFAMFEKGGDNFGRSNNEM